MSLNIHHPYPGVVLVTSEFGAVLIGAPADAFKATKAFCNHHKLLFPRTLVSPRRMLVDAVPQFNPEFFLYDFLFVYGAAFKPQLADERLNLVLRHEQAEGVRRALRTTLTGPTAQQMRGYRSRHGQPIMDEATIASLAGVSDNLAVKTPAALGALDFIAVTTFDSDGSVRLLDGHLHLWEEGDNAYGMRLGQHQEVVDLSIVEPVVPFATLPRPSTIETPQVFAVKALGTRSGFDLSGPTTGFLIWVNGRAIVYDGPVGTRYLLAQQSVPFDDIDGIILSHCHEDHMGAFVELIMAGHRPKLYTSEPIYRSALIKLASYFSRTEQDVASLLDYVRITPGQPEDILGATFNFFYTVHPIPTLGVSVDMRRQGIEHRVQISGDTMHHDGLDKMLAEGVLTADKHAQMRHLVPEAKRDHGLYFADVGEAIIHGHPKDWQQNVNDVVYYHCSDNEHTRSFGRKIAAGGDLYGLVQAPTIHPITSARILRALRFLQLDDPHWLATFLYGGVSRRVEAGTRLANAGDEGPHAAFSVIVAGAVGVVGRDGSRIATLQPGEFFGLMELVDEGGRSTATLEADIPTELFDIDAALFHEYIQRRGLEESMGRIWSQRPAIEATRLFCRLDVGMRNEVARLASEVRFAAGDILIAQDSEGDDFFLLTAGHVRVERDGELLANIEAADPENFFGEICALEPDRRRTSTVRAVGPVTTLRLAGTSLRALFNDHMGFRYLLELTLRRRCP